MKIAAELFPVLKEFKDNPLNTLKLLKSYGYEGLEMYGDPLMPAGKLKQVIDKSGLKLTGYQVPWRLMQGHGLSEVIDYQKQLNNQEIIIAALGGPWESGHKVFENTVNVWTQHAKRINEMAKAFKKNDMSLSYHTHDYDFGELVENTSVSLDILLQNIISDVGIEIDTGNCIEGGKIPQDELIKLGKRCKFVHCKPYSKELRYELLIGDSKDENQWPNIFEACQKVGTQWLVVEPESKTLGPSLNVMQESIQRIKRQLD